MKLLLIISALLLSNNLPACESADQADCVYEKHNIRFSYADRWHIAEESGFLSSPYVFLETEDSGLIMVMLLRKKDGKPLPEFAVEYSKSANSQIFIGAFKSKGFTDITANTQHKGIEEKLTLNLFGEEVAMTRQYFTFSSPEKVAYVILQIDDEELDDVSGLEAVLNSFEFTHKN